MKIKSLKALNRSARVSRSRAGTIVLFLILAVFACFMALPMVLIVGNAFKPADELWIFPPRLLPSSPTVENFRDMFQVLSDSWVPFTRYLFNTVFITAVGSAGHILLSSMCAFPLAKRTFPGKNVFFRIVVLSLMFNATVTAIPNYLIMLKIGWLDTYWALIVPAIGAPMGLYLMKQFMEQLPDSMLEAACLDGAGEWVSFWKIVMPNVRSAWLTLLLLCFQSLWGIGSSNFIYKEELKTLPYALSQILAAGIARAGVGAAVSVLMMIVPISVFIFTQSNIIETMATSGMKD